MNWINVKTLKSDKIYLENTIPPADPWDVAEDWMREGYLPPLFICKLLPSSPLPAYTRRRRWTLSGAIMTLKRVAEADSALMKSLRDLNKRYRQA